MNKKQIATMIILSLFLLCGCGKDVDVTFTSQDAAISVEMESSEATNITDEEEECVEKEYDHNLVCDRWADSGSFKMYTSDEEFYEFYFDYSIPQIVDDTEDAKEINYLIECLFEDMHNTMQKAAQAGEITAEEFDSTGWFQTNYVCNLTVTNTHIRDCSNVALMIEQASGEVYFKDCNFYDNGGGFRYWSDVPMVFEHCNLGMTESRSAKYHPDIKLIDCELMESDWEDDWDNADVEEEWY